MYTMSHIIDILTLCITCNKNLQTLSHRHGISTKFIPDSYRTDLLIQHTKLQYQSETIKTSQSVKYFSKQTVSIYQLVT